ncbi:transposase [Nostoc sp.]|uniref:transposase n=1 Tax=Nostoc sp. TaxID=1180 RepID=UPI003FA595ED
MTNFTVNQATDDGSGTTTGTLSYAILQANQIAGDDTVLADKGYDADERVIKRLQAQGKTVVIPPKRNRNHPRDYDRDLYKARQRD